MKKNDLLRNNDTIIRILDMKEDSVFVIDCVKRTMPKWINMDSLSCYVDCSEEELLKITDMVLLDVEMLDTESRRFVYEHYSLIAGILPFVSDKRMKNHLVARTAEERNVSLRTIDN